MKENYLLQHKTALLNPYGSIVQVLDGDPDNFWSELRMSVLFRIH